MIKVIYLVKKTITILMSFKRLEHFLMSVEAIIYLKKQMKLEKNFIKKKLSAIFLKKKSKMVV